MGKLFLISGDDEFSRKQRAREIIGDSFMEVYVKADLETCMKRDPKKLYKKAKAGEISHFTGIDSPYEEPKTPDLVLDTQQWDEVECVEMLLGAIASHGEKIKE